MGYYGYYCLVLTAIYIVYYTINFTLDIHGYQKKKSSGEVLEISSDGMVGDHDAQYVSETDDGFNVGGSIMPIDDLHADTDLDDYDLGSSESSEGGAFDYSRHYDVGGDTSSGTVSGGGSSDDDNIHIYSDDDVAEVSEAYERAQHALGGGLIETLPMFEEDYDSEEYDVLTSQPQNLRRHIFMEVLKM